MAIPKINRKTPQTHVVFDSLEVGEFFTSNANLYLKIAASHEKANAFNLDRQRRGTFSGKSVVYIEEVEINVT